MATPDPTHSDDLSSVAALPETSAAHDTVIVVGGGIVGLACAHYLNESGCTVQVIDRASIGGACSRGNLGYVCPSHVLPLTEPGAIGMAVKSFFQPRAPFRVKPRLDPAFWNWLWQFARRCNHRDMLAAGKSLQTILDSSVDEYRRLVQSLPLACEWQDDGLLYVFETAAGLEEFSETADILAEEFGVTADFVEGNALNALDGALKANLAGAYHYKSDASLRPDLLTRQWVDALLADGVTITDNCAFLDVDYGAEGIAALQTSRGRLSADRYVFAAGAWSTKLASQLKCRIPVEPGKGYSVTMNRPANCPHYPMLFPEHKVGVAPFEDGYRLGSMMEFTGFDTSIPEHRIEQLRDSAKPYLVEPFTDVVQDTWFGWRPMTWDSLPIIGRLPKLANTYLATGHNMLGVSLATGTGKLIAELVDGRSPHIDAQPFSPQRF